MWTKVEHVKNQICCEFPKKRENRKEETETSWWEVTFGASMVNVEY